MTDCVTCRLCASTVEKKFTLTILGKYDVDYFRCDRCQSLQTAEPFWLQETYSGTLPNLDEGAARRALRTSAVVLLSAKILRAERSALLDFGGGDGLTCRLLRDIGFNAYCYDKYAKNFYSDRYCGDPHAEYDIVVAVELLEHLSNPKTELELIFSQRPKMVIVATEFYHGQGPEWSYIGNEHGGHVFFFSEQSLAMVAEQYGYEVVISRGTAIFWRGRIAKWRRFFIAQVTRPELVLIGKCWAQTIRPRR